MKKNVMMRIASILLVCVLITTCGISGTFAKYTTQATGNDSARVAYWGFKTNSLTIDMFDGNYDNNAVNAATNVVAPGTSKTVTIELIPDDQVAPEVAYTFDLNITASGNEALLNELVWSLNGNEVGDFDDLIAAINTAYDKPYAANVLPTAEIVIKWEWKFEVGTGAELEASDATDTNLGNNNAALLTITLDFTATQVNDLP